MDNCPEINYHTFPFVVEKSQKSFKDRHNRILQLNVNKITLALQYEPQEIRIKKIGIYQQSNLDELQVILFRYRQQHKSSETSTSTYSKMS